jgi:dTDP-glucose 4,6-dehydratase
MNLLVTGGAGFIGSHLVQFLLARPEISRLVNLDALTYAGHRENLEGAALDSRYHFAEVDLRDKPALQTVMRTHDITHVMHLAAESHVDRSIAGPSDFIESNVLGTFNLLECCRAFWGQRMEGKRFHHVSTDEVYGSLGSSGCFNEQSPYAPSSPYAASKAGSDMLVRAWHHTYGLPVVLSNSSNNFGPRQYPEKLIPVVIQAAFLGQAIPVYGDGQQVRDWLYVEDHVEALWKVLTAGKDGRTYGVGGGHEKSNLEIVEQICDLCDAMASPGQGSSREWIRFVKDRPGHDRRYALDSSRIQSELGWRPMVSFDEALRQTVQWYIENQAWVNAVGGRR